MASSSDARAVVGASWEMEIFKKPITATVTLIAQAILGTGGAHGEVVFRLELTGSDTRPTMFVEAVKPEVARLLWDMSKP